MVSRAMALGIETFSNADLQTGWRPGNNFGGSTLFKALGHPRVQALGRELVAHLKTAGRVAIYDPSPQGQVDHFDAFFGLRECPITEIFVQRLEDLGRPRLGRTVRPVTELARCDADVLFVCAFDAQTLLNQLGPWLPPGLAVVTLDAMRLPQDWLSNSANYLDPVNFATNFALMIDRDGRHTRVATANYWGRYGADKARLWLCLFDEDGAILAEWVEDLPPALHAVRLDSRAIRQRFGLDAFAGSLFIHALNVKGHDVVKYALDYFSDDGTDLMCTHDANAWPADLYAGVPAPADGEEISLWVQNSHPIAIPAGGFGINLVGHDGHVALYDHEVPPFATHKVDLGKLLPKARWPQQIEIRAGRYFVRPRYEVRGANGRSRMNHANVERIDLKPDPRLGEISAHLGKGFIMPLPVPPLDQFRTVTLPTPMADTHRELPLKVALVDANGTTVAERHLGKIARNACPPLDVDAWLHDVGKTLPSGYGHVEYLYDFRDGGEADGWLHALAQIEQRSSGHMAETIFGAHVYNVPVLYRDEPQSYTHKPPGLTTRLFLRVGDEGTDTLCHLIYAASLPWHATSSTMLTLHDGSARPVASRDVRIACGGSLHWRVSEMFGMDAVRQAGTGAWVEIRDTTCRLFGFHGLVHGDRSFCLDHMFGF